MELNEIKDNEIIKASVCSRCGCVEFARPLYPGRNEFSRTGFNSLPGWSSYFGAWTLCPEYSKDFRNVWDTFINTKSIPAKP